MPNAVPSLDNSPLTLSKGLALVAIVPTWKLIFTLIYAGVFVSDSAVQSWEHLVMLEENTE